MLSLVKNEEKENNDLEKILNSFPPPDFMGYEAKCEWIRCVGDLVEKGIFVGPNIGLFESYCVATGEARDLEQMLSVDGRIVNGKPHPAYRMMLDAMSTARGIWAEIKPKKLVVKEEEEKNDWEKDKGLLA